MDFRGRLSLWQRFVRAFETFDSWTAFSLSEGGRGLSTSGSAIARRMDRLQVRGARRVGVELACEGLTLGVGGLLLMLALAIPAFREVGGDDWLKAQDLAVTFLDRYGNEVGRRGIRHDDRVPLDRFSRPSDQGRARHRGPPLLRAFRHRHHRHDARPDGQCPRVAAWCRAARR